MIMRNGEGENASSECSNCGVTYAEWKVFCSNCGCWRVINQREPLDMTKNVSRQKSESIGYAGSEATLKKLADILPIDPPRIGTGVAAFNDVLGGGMVQGSVVLLAGNPGCGKSTLTLQVSSYVSSSLACLIVSAEETEQQIANRANRLGLNEGNLNVMIEDDVAAILAGARSTHAKLVVIDSLAAVMDRTKKGERGSAAQLECCLGKITRYAKESNAVVLVICQSTKEGDYAGPRVLEHLADALLFMAAHEATGRVELSSRKNRFGSTRKTSFLKFSDPSGRLIDNESLNSI